MNKRKKIFLIIIFFYLLIFINFTCINAQTTSCEYSDLGINVFFDESGTASITQTKYDEYDYAIPILDWFVGVKSGSLEYVNELKEIKEELYGSCPKQIYACTYEKTAVGALGISFLWTEEHSLLYSHHNKVFLFYSENNMKENDILKDLPNKEKVKTSEFVDYWKDGSEWGESWGCSFCGGVLNEIGGTVANLFIDNGTEIYYEAYKNCNYVYYTGKLPTYNLACPNLNVYLEKFNKALNEYKDCSDAVCMSKTITAVNEKEELIKNYCKSILEHHSFDGSTEQSCLEACIDIGIQTKKAKIAVGLTSGKPGECGFSERLLVWIRNILRWIKYILPVAVIVLGILDFIKAIGADKDDEMKKAQGKFVKRLIAAALVFIIPLIIEFVLGKMGFGYNSCGLF